MTQDEEHHKFIYSINMLSIQRGAVQMEFRNSHKFYGRVWSFIICKRYHKAGHGYNNDLIWWEINYTSAINNPRRALPSPAPRRCAHREAHCRTAGHKIPRPTCDMSSGVVFRVKSGHLNSKPRKIYRNNFLCQN